MQYGLVGAGTVSRSLIARLPDKSQDLGPVVAISHRVASRISNSLRGGKPARDPSALDAVELILFCSTAAHAGALIELLENAAIHWQGKSVVIFDSDVPISDLECFRQLGAHVASIRQMGLPGRILMEGDDLAVRHARILVRQLGARGIQISGETAGFFYAGMTMATGALTPLIEGSADCFRRAGLRDKEASQLAAALFEKTARGFAHSGRQSWAWHMHKPDLPSLVNQLKSLARCPRLAELFLRNLLFAFESFDRHRDAECVMRDAVTQFENDEEMAGAIPDAAA